MTKPTPDFTRAEVTRELVEHLERTGPGGLIVYDHTAKLFQVSDIPGFGCDEDTEAFIVYGYGDLVHDLGVYVQDYPPPQDAHSALVVAIDETVCDLVGEWFERPPLPAHVTRLRRALARRDFHLNHRPDWSGDGSQLSDRYVFGPAPHVELVVEMPLAAVARTARMRLLCDRAELGCAPLSTKAGYAMNQQLIGLRAAVSHQAAQPRNHAT